MSWLFRGLAARLGRKARCTSWLLVCLCAVALSETARASPTQTGPPDLAWHAPRQARIARLFQAERPGVSRNVDAKQAIPLKVGDYLVVPVRPGDRVRVAATRAELGFGTGYHALPDAVTWQKEVRLGSVEWRVPGYSSARFLVVRSLLEKDSDVRVWTAAPLDDPLAWYRADDLVFDFIAGDQVKLPTLPQAARVAEPIVRWLGAARRVLSRPKLTDESKRWLQARWLSLSMQYRPLYRPFFYPELLQLQGGREWQAAPDEVAADHERPRVLAAGDRLAIVGVAAEVVSLLVRPAARGVTRYSVYSGDELVFRVDARVPERGARQGFLGPRLYRVMPPDSGAVKVVVEEGELVVEAQGYSLNTSVFDFSLRRQPRALLEAGSRSKSKQGQTQTGALLLADRLRSAQGRKALGEALQRTPSSEVALRALLLHEELLHHLGASDVVLRLSRLWKGSRPLSEAVRLPLRRSALAAVLDISTGVFDEPLELPEQPEPGQGPPRSAAEHERALIAALRATLAPKRDGSGPGQSVRTERWAAASTDSELSTLAAKVWSREAVYKPLDSETAETTDRLTRVEAVGACSARGPGGLRWLAAQREQPLLVKAVGGSHSRLQIQGQPGVPLADAAVAIDDERFSVHAGAQLATNLAVRPGTYQFRQLSGEPLLLRYETAAEFPCERLYEQERWVIVDGKADFTLPPGLGASVLSVLVAEESLGAPAELRVTIAGASQRAAFEGRASGVAEFHLPANLERITLESERRLLVLVRVKQRRNGFGKPVKQEATRVEPVVSEKVWLERLRAATRALRTAESDVARGEHRTARIAALEALGYVRLAAVDRARLDDPPPPPPSDPLPFMALRLPPGAAAIEAVGVLPLIPPLPQPDPGGWFAEMLAAKLKGMRWAAVLETLERRSQQSHAVDALLLARLAEQAEKLEVAQAAWLRLAEKHGSGALLKEAARLTTDLAANTLDLKQTLRAYLLTLKAAREQADVDALLGRLNTSVRWLDVEAEQLTRTVWLEHQRHVDLDEPLALSVRRALTDAPDHSVLLTQAPATFFASRFPGTVVQVDALCHALSGRKENCALKVRVDGERVACLPVGVERKRAFETRRMAPEVARPLGCRVELPDGAERLTIQLAPESGAALGWASAREVTATGLGPSSYSARWMGVDAGDALGTWLAGPAVLRIEARAMSGEPTELDLRLEPEDKRVRTIEQTVALPESVDHRAMIATTKQRVFDATRTEVIIDEPGRFRLNVSARGGSALLRLSVSDVVAPPRSLVVAEDEIAGVDVPVSEALKPWPGVRVGFDPIPGALTLGASLAARWADLIEGDRDPRARHLELGVQARRALIEELLWGAGGVFQRQRVGPESHGLELGLWLTANGGWPGAFTRLEAVTQRLGGKNAVGYYAVAGVYHPFELGQKVRLVPTLQGLLRHVAAQGRGRDDADRVVYSPYAASRPHSVDFLSRLDYRAFVDFTLRAGARARAAPYFDGWDRFDLSLGGDLMTGSGWSPWLSGELLASHRPESPERERAYSRFAASPSVVFWRWLSSAQRLTLAFNGSYFFDIPKAAGRSSAFSGEVALGYEYSFERGLGDLNLGQRPFRAQQEEERPGLRRRGVGAHPYWSE